MSENATYLVPGVNLAALQSRIDVLNRRARRLGVAEIELSAALSHLEHCYMLCGNKGWAREIPAGGKATGAVREMMAVSVTGDAPKFEGWRLIGVLEPLVTDDGVENLVSAVPGYAVPADYRNRVGECDHCRTHRRRNETFVVLHDDGSTKMVGRQCLKDFLGHADPHQLAAWAEILCELDGLCRDAGDEDWLGGGCRVPDCWNLDRFLTVTAAIVRNDGWVSRTKARDCEFGPGGMATVDKVLQYLSPPPSGYRSREFQGWLDEVSALLEEPQFAEQATKAAEWARNIDAGESDYLYNCNLLVRAGYVSTKTAGIAASILAAARRDEERERAKVERAPSQHVGQVKKRLAMTVTCERIFETEGMYGVTGIHRLRDEHGNLLVWFASGSAAWLKEGETAKVKATIVSHDEFRGEKQTKVNRVAVV